MDHVGRWLLIALYAAAALWTAAHALLHKRDPRAAWGWIAVCWLFPLAGAVLYYLFGINRIQVKAERVFGSERPPRHPPAAGPLPQLPGLAGAEAHELVRIGSALADRPLCGGNRIDPLFTGAQAYAAMLEAIAGARRTVHLSTYIYRDDEAGVRFGEALARARARGVSVRVLLDGLADVVYHPRGSRRLRRLGLAPALFLPPRLWPPMLHINLRNHRKLLLVDGETGFTGGMNIQQEHVAATARRPAITDLHFRVRGPLVQQMEAVFAGDWRFASGEDPEAPAPIEGSACGEDIVGRVITEGPNEDLDRLAMVLSGAASAAHQRLWVMTPYFLPPAPLMSELQAAALRGIDVSIILPARSDQPWMDWATRHILEHLLQRQVRVYLRPPPFAHTKLLIVDDWYLQFGTANLDTRSLRLNFELMVETYGAPLARRMAEHFLAVRGGCRPLSPDELGRRSYPTRLRDALCWLGSPYL
jgi:cardiolipin synthase